jgi:hypothetical protein
MTRILKTANSRTSGWSKDQNGRSRFINDGGFVSGMHGKQRHHGGPNTVEFFEDFLGDVIPDQINIVEGSDSGTTDAAILAGGIGGVMRMTTGDAGSGLAADLVQATAALQWQASNGNLCFETRVKASAITTCYFFYGFTDLVTLEGPVISAGSVDTITTQATDAVGFMFDSRMDTDTFHLVGVANNVDATRQAIATVPVVDVYQVFRVEVDSAGAATFFVNGVQVGTKMSGAVTPGVDLTPTICVSKTSVAASMLLDVDYWHVSMDRVTGGAD